ncbi:peptidoglycan-binding domain-containing protein [Acuticoccus kandeliae]|uniref:peptidoglycan-binding domain-containing protein n=1 Tax=Acuticoccus kandeliae TaxID=2073160 RepID=UPI0013009948|nr:peptidoglycan-binding protein [Acuticoccus kandeliae]
MARRKGATIASVAGVLLLVVVGSNALWQQDEKHPAPMWGMSEGAQSFSSHGSDGVREIVLETDDSERDPLVESVQAGLSVAGYYDGPVTGVLDDDTADAIRAFERDRGLPETGEPNVAIVAEVSNAPARPVAAAPVRVAPHESAAAQMDIVQVQTLLNQKGFGPVSVDGKMGPQTRAALSRFSATRGLSSQGMTPEVLRALAADGV